MSFLDVSPFSFVTRSQSNSTTDGKRSNEKEWTEPKSRASDRFGPRKFLAFEQRRCLFPEWACALALIVSGSCAGGHVSFSKKHKQQLNEAVRVKWVRVTKASQVLLASFDRSRRPKVRKPPKRNSLRPFSLDSQSQISHDFALFGPKVMSQVVASSQDNQ